MVSQAWIADRPVLCNASEVSVPLLQKERGAAENDPKSYMKVHNF
jgi:hypothetical protein